MKYTGLIAYLGVGWSKTMSVREVDICIYG